MATMIISSMMVSPSWTVLFIDSLPFTEFAASSRYASAEPDCASRRQMHGHGRTEPGLTSIGTTRGRQSYQRGTASGRAHDASRACHGRSRSPVRTSAPYAGVRSGTSVGALLVLPTARFPAGNASSPRHEPARIPGQDPPLGLQYPGAPGPPCDQRRGRTFSGRSTGWTRVDGQGAGPRGRTRKGRRGSSGRAPSKRSPPWRRRCSEPGSRPDRRRRGDSRSPPC